MAESSKELPKEFNLLRQEDKQDLQALESRFKDAHAVHEAKIAKLMEDMDKAAPTVLSTVLSELVDLLSAFRIHVSFLTNEVYELKKQVNALKEAEG